MGIHLVAAGGHRSHSAAGGEGKVAAATDPPMHPAEGKDIVLSSNP